MHHRFSLFVVNIYKLNKIIGFKSLRYFHETISLKVKTHSKVSEYLFNRNVPACEILNNLTEEDNARLIEIKNHYNVLLTNGEMVPKILNDSDLLELLCLTYHQRIKFLMFLAKKEFSKENHRAKVMKNAAKERFTVQLGNAFTGKYFNQKAADLAIQRVIEAIVLKSQDIVFDFSFENEMTRREVKESAKQFQECFGINKKLADPFQMSILNIQPGSITYCDMKRFFLGGESPKYKKLEDLPFVFHKKPLMETYPEKEIIYLSPNSPKTFEEGEYDHDAVYVIGAIVDKGQQEPLTLAKARKEGLKHRSLPLDRYINWVTGNKNLPLGQVFNIMSIARETNGDWGTAIRQSLPARISSPDFRRSSNYSQ